ncbi:MAG: DUF1816 domain-containing protein [Prochloraceae cyanobacterium]
MSISRMSTELISPSLKLEIKKWWVEINTAVPRCTYYFGPFDTLEEAAENQDGYVQDLIEEGSRDITVNIKKCRPQALTLEVYY